MNNEMNNNVNNSPVNPGGVNFTHTDGLVNNPVSGQPGQVVTQTVVTQEVPMMTSEVPVEPQPITPSSINFVSSEPQVVSNPAPISYVSAEPQVVSNPEPVNFVSASPVASNPISVEPAAVPNSVPASPQVMSQPIQTSTPQPVMPQQPVAPPMGNIPPQMSVPPLQNGSNLSNDNKGGNKTPVLMIIITILVVVGVIVFLVLYLSGKIRFGGNNNQNNTQPAVVDKKNDEVIRLADWMNYILEQNITEVKLTRYADADDSVMSSITSQQLKELFTKMNGYTLTRDYSNRENGSDDELEVVYAVDEETFSFKIVGKYIEYDDSKLEEIFNKVENTNASDDATVEDDNYVLEDFDTSIYDSYFESQEG